MSFELINQVWSLQGIDPSSKLVLVRLADMANDIGVSWPSLSRLSEETGLARSSVCRILSSLEALGLVRREKGKHSTTYTLRLSGWDKSAKSISENASSQVNAEPDASNIVVPQSDCTSPTVGPEIVPQSDCTSPTVGHKPPKNHQRNPKRTTKDEPLELAFQVEEILPFNTPEFAKAWADWVQDRKEKRKKLTSLAQKLQWRDLTAMGHDRAVKAIYHSIKRGYQSIFEPPVERVASSTDYDIPKHRPTMQV